MISPLRNPIKGVKFRRRRYGYNKKLADSFTPEMFPIYLRELKRKNLKISRESFRKIQRKANIGRMKSTYK